MGRGLGIGLTSILDFYVKKLNASSAMFSIYISCYSGCIIVLHRGHFVLSATGVVTLRFSL